MEKIISLKNYLKAIQIAILIKIKSLYQAIQIKILNKYWLIRRKKVVMIL